MKFEQIYLCESYPVISLFNHENLSWKSTGSTPIGFNCPAVSFGLTPESYQLFVGEILAMLDIFAFACSLWFMKIVERNPKLSDVLLTCLVSCSDCYWVNPSILKVTIDRVALFYFHCKWFYFYVQFSWFRLLFPAKTRNYLLRVWKKWKQNKLNMIK